MALLSNLWWKLKGSPSEQQAVQCDKEEEKEEKEEEEAERVEWNAEHEAELPPGGVFDLQELSRWDGVNLPMCIGICGLVVDVSSSENFIPTFGYGKL
jgi:hypothetical protein